MNIDEYRKLATAESTDQPVKESEEVIVTAPVTKVKIGEEEIEIEELKRGYMRQSDYTKKTQSIAEMKKENQIAIDALELIKSDEELMMKYGEKISKKKAVAPDSEEVKKLRAQLELVQLETEIVKLSAKYKDFDEVKVLTTAKEIGVTDLEFVYKALREDKKVDETELREQIKKELLSELSAPSTITMTGAGVKASANEVKITSKEATIAKAFGMSEKDYAKFKR